MDVENLSCNKEEEFFLNNKKTLLLLRRIEKTAEKSLELRHQRSVDAVVATDAQEYPDKYVYQMIETMLPETDFQTGKEFRLVHL